MIHMPTKVDFLIMCKVFFSRKMRARCLTSRRHIQGSKIAKGLPRVNLQYSKIEKAKKWTEWRSKRGTLPKLSTFLSQLKGDPLEKKQIFEKKVS